MAKATPSDQAGGARGAAGASELKRQIREVAARLTELGRERRALAEVREGQLAEARTLDEQIARAQAEQAELREQRVRERRRVAEVDRQLEAIQLEAPIIERRREERLTRAGALRADRVELEQGILRYERGLSSSGVELRLLKESLAQLDHRLQPKSPES